MSYGADGLLRRHLRIHATRNDRNETTCLTVLVVNLIETAEEFQCLITAVYRMDL